MSNCANPCGFDCSPCNVHLENDMEIAELEKSLLQEEAEFWNSFNKSQRVYEVSRVMLNNGNGFDSAKCTGLTNPLMVARDFESYWPTTIDPSEYIIVVQADGEEEPYLFIPKSK